MPVWVTSPIQNGSIPDPAPSPVSPAMPHTGDTLPNTQAWEERGEYHGLQLHVDPHDMAPSFPAPRKLQPENPADGIESFVDASGATFNKELSFQAHSVLVDNFTGQWLWFPSANRWVPPYTIGMVLPMPRATQSAQYQLTAPPSYIQPAVVAGQVVVTTWFGWMLQYSPGVYDSASFGKGTITTTTANSIVSVASASATQLLAANPARKSAFFQNLGANNIAIGPDNSVVATGGAVLAPGATPPAGGGTFNDTSTTGAWWGRAATGPTNLLVFEVG